MRLGRVGIGLFVVSALAATAACGDGAPTSAPAPPVGVAAPSGISGSGDVVNIQATSNLQFVPATASAVTGQVVKWTNTGGPTHNVTFNGHSEITSGDVASNQTWEVKFTTPGTYSYICTFHAPGMAGTINVTQGAAPASSGSASSSASTASATATP